MQVGLLAVLLVGAALFARSLRNLATADLGFTRENLLLVDVRPAAKTPQAWRQFWENLEGRLTALPGVRAVALAGDAVFGYGGWNQDLWIERPGQAPEQAQICFNVVTPEFFTTTGIPLLAGRAPGPQDTEQAPQVALVNRAFARRFFGDANAIGMRFGDRGAAAGSQYEIVGVVGDAKYGRMREQIQPMVFCPAARKPPLAASKVHICAVPDAGTLARLIRDEVRALNTDVLGGPV